MEYKFVELLSCQLTKGSEDATKIQVSQRFNHLRQRSTALQTRLEDVLSVVSVHLMHQPSESLNPRALICMPHMYASLHVGSENES